MKQLLFRAYNRARPWLRRCGMGLGLHDRLYRFVRHRLDPERVELDGFHLYLDPDDDILSFNLARGYPWEPEETALFRSLLREGSDVIDVGAHIGYYAILASRGVGARGRVFAFEPSPANFALLRKNLESNGCSNVRALPLAVAETPGRAELHLDPRNTGGHSLVARDGRSRTVGVDCVALDGWMEREQVRPALVKIDVEGAEWGVLAGMRGALERYDDLSILMEFFPERIAAGGRRPQELLELLAACGFGWQVVGSPAEGDGEPGVERTVSACRLRGYVNLLCRKRA